MKHAKLMKRLTYGLIVLAMVSGCSSMSVHADFAQGTDFSGLETFQYRESDSTVAGADPLADQRIVAAIKREMTASGLNEVAADPDVVVSYYGSTEEQLQFNTTYTGVSSWGRRGRRMGMSVGGSTTRATTFEEGTLVIDIWEVEGDQLIWRGVVSDTLSGNPDRNTEKINRGISRVFEDFPPS